MRIRLASVLTVTLALLLAASCRFGPPAPPAPTGPGRGRTATTYTFTTRIVSVAESLRCRFQWSDSDTGNWSDWLGPDETTSASHAWTVPGRYHVRAQTQNARRQVSP